MATLTLITGSFIDAEEYVLKKHRELVESGFVHLSKYHFKEQLTKVLNGALLDEIGQIIAGEVERNYIVNPKL